MEVLIEMPAMWGFYILIVIFGLTYYSFLISIKYRTKVSNALNPDKFYYEYIKQFKDKFDDDTDYSGRYIKLELDQMLTRIK